MQKIFVCDDDNDMQNILSDYFQSKYDVELFCTGNSLLSRLHLSIPDAILLDLSLPDIDGEEILRQIRSLTKTVPIIIITGNASIQSAMNISRLGAADLIEKPFQLSELSRKLKFEIKNFATIQNTFISSKNRVLLNSEILGNSPAIVRLNSDLKKVAKKAPPVCLIHGDIGVGKRLVAHHIHKNRHSKNDLFIEIDAAAYSAEELAAKLFGVESASSLGHPRIGFIEIAAKGSLFIKEIDHIETKLQILLLEAIENGFFFRVGGTTPIKMECMLITSSHQDLALLVHEKKFRADLYYRLSAAKLYMPNLEERTEDIKLLISFFINKLNIKFSTKVNGISPKALEVFVNHKWRGNVRELRSILEQIFILNDNISIIEKEHLPEEMIHKHIITKKAPPQSTFELPRDGLRLEELEQSLILQALHRSQNNQTEAAKLLGISRFALRYRLEKIKTNQSTNLAQ